MPNAPMKFPSEEELRANWTQLKGMLEDNLKDPPEYHPFERMYTLSFGLVFHCRGELLFNGYRKVLAAHLRESVLPNLTKTTSSDRDFLTALHESWNVYEEKIGRIKDYLMYYDRVYVDKYKVPTAYNLGLEAFRTVVIRNEEVRKRLQKILFEIVCKERSGDTSQREDFESTCQILMDMSRDSRCVYEEAFEIPFLVYCCKLHLMGKQHFLDKGDVLAFLRITGRTMADELERSVDYLDPGTRGKFVKFLEQKIVQPCADMVAKGEKPECNLSGMLKSTQHVEDVKLMYRIFRLFPDCLKTMLAVFESELRKEGLEIVEEMDESYHCELSYQFVRDLLDLYSRFDEFLTDALANDPLFTRSIAKTFSSILNSCLHFPEYLARFIDTVVRGAIKESGESVLLVLGKALALARFIRNKETRFEKHYCRFLIDRVLTAQAPSVKLEAYLAQELTEVCGDQFGSHMQRLHQEAVKSCQLVKDFNTCLIPSSKMDFSFNFSMLSPYFAPISGFPQKCCRLPPDAEKALAKLRQFRLLKCLPRKPIFYHLLGSAVLQGNFERKSDTFCPDSYETDSEESEFSDAEDNFCDPEQFLNDDNASYTYTFTVTTCQMCILMLFNNCDRLSCERISSLTHIPIGDLEPALEPLCLSEKENGNLLVYHKFISSSDDRNNGSCDPNPDRFSSFGLSKEDSFSFNQNFRAKKCAWINLSAVRRGSSSFCSTDSNYRWKVDAAIARVLKCHQRLSHALLVCEVLALLTAAGIEPDVSVVKQRIHSLIDKHYLATEIRDGSTLYAYVE